MTEKRFTIESERINNTYSIHIYKDDEVIFEISNWDSLSSMHKKECEDIVDLLNELNDENTHIKNTIQEAYKTERTQIGKNVLKNLWDRIQ